MRLTELEQIAAVGVSVRAFSAVRIDDVLQPIATRRASLDDLDALLAHVQAGFDSYLAFAPEGWRPPAVEQDRSYTSELLADQHTWALVALVRADGDPSPGDGAASAPAVAQRQRTAGHVAFCPARERDPADERHWRDRPLIPGLVHLWQLFVLPEWWGRDVADLLHEQALTEMRSRQFEHARLMTPSLHARARRFYERRGWAPVHAEWNRPLQLDLTEYRLEL